MINFIKKQFKKILITLGILGVAFAAPALLPETPHNYQAVVWEKPTTIETWAEDVKKENFNVKHYYQLEQMEENLTEKLPKVQKDLDKFNQCPDCIKWELREQLGEEFSGGELDKAVNEEFDSQLAYYKWKTDKINQSLERLDKEKELRDTGKVDRKDEILGTTYYIDADCGTPGNGTTATCTGGANDSYDDLDDFTEVARSAGDKAILRRSRTANYDNASDLLFTSDGTITNPIVIEADYANAWTDDVDLSGTGTATLTFGSKTITFSADISGVLSAGDWIYASGDTAKDFAYEVATVSTITVTLYLPYKGAQAGSGKTMTNMGDAPIWNTAAGNYQWDFDNDHYWKIQGIHIRGTDSLGNVEINTSHVHQFIDCIFEGNGGSDYGINCRDDNYVVRIDKSRFYNHQGNIEAATTDAYGLLQVHNVLLDGNSVSLSSGISAGTYNFMVLEGSDIESKNHANGYGDIELEFYGTRSYIRGSNLQSNYEENIHNTGKLGIEDYNSTLGENVFLTLSGEYGGDVFPVRSETSVVRSGGGNTSIKVTPTTRISSNWKHSMLPLFEYPIYADTTSKTYTVYFKSPSDTWTANPTASELWIEAEYWGHATNNHRRITKSTGTLDFNGTTTWNGISVTAQPSQTGILYLRGYYAKTKEAGTNLFYVDVAPVIN